MPRWTRRLAQWWEDVNTLRIPVVEYDVEGELGPAEPFTEEDLARMRETWPLVIQSVLDEAKEERAREDRPE